MFVSKNIFSLSYCHDLERILFNACLCFDFGMQKSWDLVRSPYHAHLDGSRKEKTSQIGELCAAPASCGTAVPDESFRQKSVRNNLCLCSVVLAFAYCFFFPFIYTFVCRVRRTRERKKKHIYVGIRRVARHAEVLAKWTKTK